MANGFSKEEVVNFDQVLKGFDDALVMTEAVAKYSTDQVQMARTGDVIWRPVPYIMPSYDGMDQTSNFRDKTQLSVPATIGFQKSSPFVMDAKELRDALQERRLGEAASQKLASDINVALLRTVADQGTIFVKRSGAASGFDDLAAIDAALNERGVPMADRWVALSSRDYNGMASDLSKADRSLIGEISPKALRDAFVGRLSGINTLKLDYARRQAAAAGGAGLQISTLAASSNNYVPKATAVGTTGVNNVDNRYQRVTLSSNTGVAAGDAFTIANVESVHQITKERTGQPMTFRVIEVVAGSATDVIISPPIISAQNGEDAAVQYQNCSVVTASGTAAITFLNTVAAAANPFWVKGACELLPGRLEFQPDAGMSVMRASLRAGIEAVMVKQGDIKTGKVFYRFDVLFGTVLTNPEMAGVIEFSQT
jgi:hypothetical protein